ncbi:MAG: hypothetical protein LBN24_05665 [Mediterranea sp.]|jgi:outer membrane protein OmpA-like peptidoglycan-associated protein|nr:hypothetical protein [Mediterranea sp.]
MKRLLWLAALLVSSTYLLAQRQPENRDLQGFILYGPYQTNGFLDNWFVGIGVGANVYEGEHNNKASLGNRIAPSLDVTVGKWFTPCYGARLQYNGLSSRGLTLPGMPYAKPGKYSGSYAKQKFNVMNLHTDFLWNLSNAFWGFNEQRLWNCSAFVGLGWARSAAEGLKDNEMSATFGVWNTFRLTERIDLTLEARQMIVNQRFDKEASGSRGEGQTAVTVGVSAKLGKTRWQRVHPMDPYAEAVMQANLKRMYDKNKRLMDAKEQLADEVEVLKKQKNDTIFQPVVSAAPMALFFKVGQAVLSDKDLVNLDFYVKNALSLDKNASFTLVGSADKGTGTESANERLSSERVDYVYNLLIQKYGIAPNRLIKKPEGDSNNRFATPELNRAVLILK